MNTITLINRKRKTKNCTKVISCVSEEYLLKLPLTPSVKILFNRDNNIHLNDRSHKTPRLLNLIAFKD